jgi:predicted secreted protein
MQVKAEGAVQGYVERRSREGKCLRSVDLYVKGKDPGVLRLGIPEDQMPLIEVCKQAEGKQAKGLDRSAEVRTDRTHVLRSVWIGSAEVTAEGGRPVDLTIILVAVLLLAFLTGLGVGRL